MKLNRSIACALAGAALFASTFAAPASADAGGSVTVPLASLGCDKDVTVWWDTTKPRPVGTSGSVSC